MSRTLALVQWSKTFAVLLIIAGLQILLLDVALFIAYFLNSENSEHHDIRYTNELYEHFNIEYYENYESSIDKYDSVNIYYITSDKNIIYFIDQTIYICTGGDVDQIDDYYYYIALKEMDDKHENYIIREPPKEELEKLYKEIKNSYYEKPKQKKFDNFIKNFISL